MRREFSTKSLALPGLAAVLVVALSFTPCEAVTDEEIFRDFRFNFINPGGRSLGMGGSFIAIADDATAAQANPAGLTNMFLPQLFVEARSSRVDRSVTNRTFDFPSTADGFDISSATEPETRSTPSYLSYVYSKGRLRLALSRQEVLNIRSSTENTIEFRVDAGDVDERRGRGEIDLLLVHWNASFGIQLHERFRLGATASYGRMDLRSSLFNTYELIETPAAGSLVDVPIELFSTESNGSDDDLSFTLGFLWSPLPKLWIGGVARQGGDYSIDQRLTAQKIPTGDPATVVPATITSRVFFNESGTELTSPRESFDFQNEFHVPDTTGFGISWKPKDNLTLSTDLVRIAWSDLLEGFNSRLNVLTIGWETEEEAAFTVDDQTNLHVGVEYDLFTEKGAIWSFRGGYHINKDNRLRADFPDGEFGFGLANNDNFARGRDEHHYALGLGVVLSNLIQLDFAGDASRNTFEFVASLTYFFGGSE